MATKRKAGELSPSETSSKFIPKSITSYLCGALATDFACLRELIRRQNAFVDEGHSEPEQYLDQLIEELFRYLYLISDCIENQEIQLSPSFYVDKAFHSLLLDPVLYHRICDRLLTLRGKSVEERPIRVLPHNPLGGNNLRARNTRYQNTLVSYATRFNEDPPSEIWPQKPDHFYHENGNTANGGVSEYKEESDGGDVNDTENSSGVDDDDNEEEDAVARNGKMTEDATA